MPSFNPGSIFLSAAFILMISQTSGAQSYWQPVREDEIEIKAEKRLIQANAYKTFGLDLPAVRSLFAKAPLEKPGQDDWKGAVPLSMPMPDGSIMRFELLQRHTMHPHLMAQYPLISNGIVRSVEDPSLTGVVDVTYQGFHAMLFTRKFGNVFIDPLMHLDTSYYMVYRKADFYTDKSFECATESKDAGNIYSEDEVIHTRVADNQLRTYRTCIAATGEYSAFHGGTVAGALSAVNTSNNRVSGLMTKEFAVVLQIIPTNNLVIFTNSTTDPYTNYEGDIMLDENQNALDSIIGSSNYNLGHVFSTGGGGIAYLGVPCLSGWKAGGVTGLPAPVGDPFDIDFVAHEMGHQFGGNHTQYNNCQRNNSTAWEPGSASTIMGYAGICSPNVQSNSDAYYHVGNVAEIVNVIVGSGNSCPIKTTLANQEPLISVVPVYSYIPRSTPFELTAIASDPDGGTLNYCWEQMDRYLISSPDQTMPPAGSNVSGPVFRSFSPVTSPSRTFPGLSSILSGTNANTWEVLPSIERTLNFRVSARDWASSGGRSDTANVVVRVSAAAGPFTITYPNTSGLSFQGGTTQTITWNVASTNTGNVNCASVDILLSLDGGQTFPYMLADNAANDGSHDVLLPNEASSTARIKVKAEGNVFFDINNTNFSISFNPLPVSLTRFYGNVRSEGHLLQWEAAAELRLASYELERSLNGLDYVRLAAITPAGSETKSAAYQYLDKNPAAGNNYYRLKMSDLNGDYEYSGQIILQKAGNSDLSVFPNPAEDELHLQWSEKLNPVHITLINSLGQIVLRADTDPSSSKTVLSIAELPAGAYFLRMAEGSYKPVAFRKK